MYLISGWNVQTMCIGQESPLTPLTKTGCFLNSGGKIDRLAVAQKLSASFDLVSHGVGPVGVVADAWRSALGFGFAFNGEDVSFMESGGNSAGLMKLASLLRQHWPHLAYDEIMEAASVSYNCLLKLCQSSKKRKHEDTEVEMVTDTAAEAEGDVGPAETVEVLQRGGEDVAPLAMDKIGVQFL
jgi:hypothetical protein